MAEDIGIGAVISPALSIAGTWYGQREADKRQHQAQDFEERMFRNRYQYQVQDLRAAGLNPMLAYGAGPGGAPGSSAASAGVSDIGQSYTAAKQASAYEASVDAQIALNKAEEMKKMKEASLVDAQIDNVKADTMGKVEIPAQVQADVLYKQNAAYNLKGLTDKIQDDIKLVRAQIDKTNQEKKTSKSQEALNRRLTELKDTERQLMESQAYLNNMHMRLTSLEADIKGPKARAAQTWSGTAAAHGQNMYDMFRGGKEAVQFFKEFKP